jgi:DNA-binding NtrC family response regulator
VYVDAVVQKAEGSVRSGSSPTILILDDQETARQHLRVLFTSTKEIIGEVKILESADIPTALRILSSTPVHVLLLDKCLRDANGNEFDGIEYIPEFLQTQPHLQVLMLTASDDTQDIVRATRYGAENYVIKDSGDEILLRQVNKLIMVAKLKLDQERRTQVPSRTSYQFTAKALSTRRLVDKIERICKNDLPVLLLGETGVGKTKLAQYIHERRSETLEKSGRPFIDVNLSAITTTLIEAEIFGYEKGAFTGALTSKMGRCELANGGTLFLDEIGEISLDVQKKLLTVLDGGEFTRLGSSRKLYSQFKLICATNQNLEELVRLGKFRKDLFMRISMFCFEIPSMSERREDIPEIIRALLPKCCRESGINISFEELPQDFIEELASAPPPGNMRGLIQQLCRLLVFTPTDRFGKPVFTDWRSTIGVPEKKTSDEQSSDAISFQTLREARFNVIGPGFPGLKNFVKMIEEKVIEEAREKFGKNIEIAKALKISDTTVSRLRQ